METSDLLALIALTVSVVGTAVSVPLAVRADRRASVQHRLSEVVWELEPHPRWDTWITLRNTGRADAYGVTVRPNIGVPVEQLPQGVVVKAGDGTAIHLGEGARVESMFSSIVVTWQRKYLARGKPQEAAVSTAKVRADIAARRTEP